MIKNMPVQGNSYVFWFSWFLLTQLGLGMGPANMVHLPPPPECEAD